MRELKVGDNIWLRDDLLHGVECGETCWVKEMRSGTLEKVTKINLESEYLDIEDEDGWCYTLEMIDWDKTHKMWEEQERNNKQETIIMPKIFDDWVKSNKDSNGEQLVYVLVSDHIECELDEDMEKLFEDRVGDCYRALLDGYEVEKEQLYTVDIGCNKGLVKIGNGSISLALDYKFWDMSDKALTQSEIENSEHGILMAIAEKVEY